MILVDANLLVYAHVASFEQHASARRWLDAALNGATQVGLPWPSLLAFMRLVTNPRIFDKPETPVRAWSQIRDWLSCDNVWIPQPTEQHAEILGSLLTKNSAYGNLVPDAHLAALAIEHGLALYSADSDFARFAELRWFNPISLAVKQ